MEIRDDIRLPTGSTAQLRQATPLGDVFIALTTQPAPSETDVLTDGDTIPIESTSAGATVEELLVSVSMLFNGGGVANLSRLGAELGSILNGHGGDLAHLVTELTGVIGELNSNSSRIDSALTEFNAVADTIEVNKQQLGSVADTLPQALGAIAENNQAIGDLLAELAMATTALGDYSATTGDQLAALLGNLDNLMHALAATGDSLGFTLDQLHVLRPNADANFEGKSMTTFATLTNLDVGLLTDPADSKLWDLRDVNEFVGSFLQVLQVIQGRIGGHR